MILANLLCAQEPEQPQEKVFPILPQLEILAAKGFPGPVVSILDVPAKEYVPAEDGEPPAVIEPKSLEEIAATFGLKLFEQDGVYVLGPENRIDIAGMMSHDWRPVSGIANLVAGMNDSQVRALASAGGLAFAALSSTQQAMVAEWFAPGGWIRRESQESVESPGDEGSIPADALPLDAARLLGWLDVQELTVVFPNQASKEIGASEPPASHWCLRPGRSRQEQAESLQKGVPNTLKESDLDYSLPALAERVSANGMLSLRDLVDLVVRKTGLNLRASPGSDKVFLFISASDIPAGKLLKAVSLATTGTWRRFGDSYVFAPDKTGLGQFAAKGSEVRDDLLTSWLVSDYLAQKRLASPAILASMPAPYVRFRPNLDQIRLLLNAGAEDYRLPWSSLTPDQQAFFEQELALANREELRGPPAERADWEVEFTLMFQVSCSFPGTDPILIPPSQIGWMSFGEYGGGPVIGNTQGLIICPSWYEDDPKDALLRVNAPLDLHIFLKKPIRGCICKPSRTEKPNDLISMLEKHGFNALYLRVFTSGYTAFPSKQFPSMSGLDANYLKEVISLAHSKGIKVSAVVDVLRWSDGSKRAWVSNESDVLDYDILGRTHAEFGRQQSAWLAGFPLAVTAKAEMAAEQGEGLTGDAVTPCSPEVGSKLQGLLAELAKYDLDGLMLDFTTMWHVPDDMGFSEAYMTSRPGHSPLARLEFFRLHGVDSVDIPTESPSMGGCLQPIADACAALYTTWAEFYRKGCDDLLESLIKSWRELRTPNSALRTPNSESANPDSELRTPNSALVLVLVSFRAGRESHDWPRFKDLADGVVISGTDFPGTHGTYYGLKSYPFVRAVEGLGTLRFGSLLSSGLGRDLEGMPDEFKCKKPWESDGVIIDMTSAGRKKSDYLRLIVPPAKNR